MSRVLDSSWVNLDIGLEQSDQPHHKMWALSTLVQNEIFIVTKVIFCKLISYFVCSHIWLNLLVDDLHCGYFNKMNKNLKRNMKTQVI
jgi:hypothetical protein